MELNLQVKQINIARSAKVVLHKLPGKSSLNVRSVCPSLRGDGVPESRLRRVTARVGGEEEMTEAGASSWVK